jgi:hypothetical protein
METRNTADLSLIESEVLNELEKCQQLTFTLKDYKRLPSHSQELNIMFVKTLDLQLPPSQRAIICQSIAETKYPRTRNSNSIAELVSNRTIFPR